MLRAAQDSFYTHIIPYLLWDDFLNFSNVNRAVLCLVNKRANQAVKRWEFPKDQLEKIVTRYHPLLHDPFLKWQWHVAFEIARGMILYNPRTWIIYADRRQGKTHFLIQFAHMNQRFARFFTTSKRGAECIATALPNCSVETVYEASYDADVITLVDDFTGVSRCSGEQRIVGTHVMTTSDADFRHWWRASRTTYLNEERYR